MRGTLRPAFHINAAKQRKAVGYIAARCLFLDRFQWHKTTTTKEVAPCCHTRTPKMPIFSLLLICSKNIYGKFAADYVSKPVGMKVLIKTIRGIRSGGRSTEPNKRQEIRYERNKKDS